MMNDEMFGMALGMGDRLRRERAEAQAVVDRVAAQRNSALRLSGTLQERVALQEELITTMEGMIAHLRGQIETLNENMTKVVDFALKELTARDERIAELAAAGKAVKEQLQVAKARNVTLNGSRVFEMAEATGMCAVLDHFVDAHPDDDIFKPGPTDPSTGVAGPSRYDTLYDAAFDDFAKSHGLKDPAPYRRYGRVDPQTGLRMSAAQAAAQQDASAAAAA